jgi:hypothetical protein
MTKASIETMMGSSVSVHEVAQGTDLAVTEGASLRQLLQLMQKNDKGAGWSCGRAGRWASSPSATWSACYTAA